ncbi:MAG: c-type cytochrome [Burkholderiaceae bacterium]
MKTLFTLLTAMTLINISLASSAYAAAGDAKRGETLYSSRCIGCHSIDENRTGPAHRGVYGRKAGSAAGYDYSPALKKSKVIWNEKTLNQWLKNPEGFIPGQKMGISVSDAQDRKDLIAYLKTQK